MEKWICKKKKKVQKVSIKMIVLRLFLHFGRQEKNVGKAIKEAKMIGKHASW